jgi:hypothetical protein
MFVSLAGLHDLHPKWHGLPIYPHKLMADGPWFCMRADDHFGQAQPKAVLIDMGWADVIVEPAKSSQQKRIVLLGQTIPCQITSIKLASPKSHTVPP